MYEISIIEKLFRMNQWNPADGEDYEYAKKAILAILKEQKVPLSRIRTLFVGILNEIEDKNPITF